MPRPRRPPEPLIYTFRVWIRAGLCAPEEAHPVWREIEVAANQAPAELGAAIPLAFGFDDPHRWSVFLSGRAWDREGEYALQSEPDPLGGPCPHSARQLAIRDVPLPGAAGKKEVLYVFDSGDQCHVGVQLVRLPQHHRRGGCPLSPVGRSGRGSSTTIP